ncbi:MAG TPA: regulatory protein RecX [Dehalococcoidia bacterium]|nr:regulatory protein RecX [Dehalococcoidia bacterium]
MDTVTVIGTHRKRRGFVKVILDSGSAFSLSLTVAADVGIQKGQTFSLHEIEQLKSTDTFHRSLNRALRLLSVRPRSEAELKNRLNRHGFDDDTVQRVIAKLKEQGLVDDAAFAQFWQENRENFRPLSRRLIGLELKQKGVDPETIAEAVAEVDDELGAYRAAQKKVRSLAGLDYQSFRKRLGAFLKRRGFDYELINRTIDRVWQEQNTKEPNQR